VTMSCIESIFTVFNLGNVFKNRVVLALDDGDSEVGIVNKIREKYVIKGWDAINFHNFSFHDFEQTYPECLRDKFKNIKKLNKKEKRAGKMKLFQELLEWIKSDETVARNHFENVLKCEIKYFSNFLNKIDCQ
jgi:hypothetical protein